MPTIAAIVQHMGLPDAKNSTSQEVVAKTTRNGKEKRRYDRNYKMHLGHGNAGVTMAGMIFPSESIALKEAEEKGYPDEDTTANGSGSSDNDASVSSKSAAENCRLQAISTAALKPFLARRCALREMGDGVLAQLPRHLVGKQKKASAKNRDGLLRDQKGTVRDTGLVSPACAPTSVAPVKIFPWATIQHIDPSFDEATALAYWTQNSKSKLNKMVAVKKRPISDKAPVLPLDYSLEHPLKVPMPDFVPEYLRASSIVGMAGVY
jgi:hypothetical protein